MAGVYGGVFCGSGTAWLLPAGVTHPYTAIKPANGYVTFIMIMLWIASIRIVVFTLA
jgi:hypothetical protein